MDYKKINAIVLANYVDKARPAFRIVIVYDYIKSDVFQLAEENTDYEYLLSKNTDFINVEKLSLITLEIADAIGKSQKEIKFYKNKSMVCHATNIDIKKTNEKVKQVIEYRLSKEGCFYFMDVIGRRNDGVNLFECGYFWHIKNWNDSIEVFSLKNTKIMLDRKNGKPKFLFKKDDGTYYHLFIQDPVAQDMVGENFTGLLVLKIDKGIARVISLIGTTKSDELVKKEEYMRDIGREERAQKREEKQEYSDFIDYKNDAEFELKYLYKCVEKRYGFHDELVFDNVIPDINDEKCKALKNALLERWQYIHQKEESYSYMDYHLHVYKNFFDDANMEKVSEYIFFLKVAAQNFKYGKDKFEALYMAMQLFLDDKYQAIDSRNLYEIKQENYAETMAKEKEKQREKGKAAYLKRNESKLNYKKKVNAKWKNFFKYEDEYPIHFEKVYLVDDYTDILFATNFEKILIEEKLELFKSLDYPPVYPE